jgi:PKD repeat protein
VLSAVSPAAWVSVAQAAGDPSSVVRLDLDPASEGFWTLPPCYSVTFTAQGVTGKPPISLTWDSDLGERFTGNPIHLDTTAYTGFHRLTIHATNPYGSASRDVFFRVEYLSVPTPIATSPNPSPDLTISVTAEPVGATEWHWLWGDGSQSPWTSDCSAFSTSHTYPASGTYQLRMEARSCNEGPLQSAPLTVTVGDSDAIDILVWQVEGCQSGFCVFQTGDPLTFDQLFSAIPDRLDYDWDGDGTPDQSSLFPIPTHTYLLPGAYRPILTAHRGTSSATRQHDGFILIEGPAQHLVFEDGFETGDLGAWSRAVSPAESVRDRRGRQRSIFFGFGSCPRRAESAVVRPVSSRYKAGSAAPMCGEGRLSWPLAYNSENLTF